MQIMPRGRKEWVWFAARWGTLAVAAALAGHFMISMPGSSHSGPLPPLSAEEERLRAGLEKHVTVLAGKIGERNLWNYEALEAAARYIARSLGESGYPTSEQPFTEEGRVVRNVEAIKKGSALGQEIIIVGGHYDTVLGSPGANDNATGTAAVLEIARLLAEKDLARTVRFVAFVNEEPPFFLSDRMGSRVYARRARERGEKIVAMFSLETIGFYSDREGSQRYPLPFGFFYPRTANFIGFVSNLGSRNLARRAIASFRSHTSFPSEGVAAPGWMIGIGWSDHWSFWREGYPAIMITDTALFRYDFYHGPEDTPDKIEYERAARVVAGIVRVIEDLAAD